MKEINDYLGHKINIGDILLYNQKASKGYYSSFEEGLVVMIHKGRVLVCSNDYDLENYKKHINEDCAWIKPYVDGKYGENTVNLTALGLRENKKELLI